MAGNLSPGIGGKKRAPNGCGAMVLIASADAGLGRRWALGLKDTFVIHEVSKWVELERTLTHSKPAVLLLDSDLPQLDEVKGSSKIHRLSPSTKIILLTPAHDERKAIDALKAGAKGYCNKQIEPPLLRKAVNVVQKGEIWVGRNVIPRLLDELTSFTERRQGDPLLHSNVNLDCLTTRERQIALLIGNGSCNKEIAAQLNITERTVKAHLTSVFFKLKISDRLHLALFVTEYDRATP